jgi:hypothetical protein
LAEPWIAVVPPTTAFTSQYLRWALPASAPIALAGSDTEPS